MNTARRGLSASDGFDSAIPDDSPEPFPSPRKGGVRLLHYRDLTLRAQATSPHTVVVIPAYNEERFIASVVVSARRCARAVIVVDDGSTDRTADFARDSGAEVIQLPTNQGKGAALNAAFARARRLAAHVVVTIDADAQHDAAEIPILAEPVLENRADIVIGSRFLEAKSDIPRWRRFGQHTLTRLTNAGSGTSITDSQSGYRAFSRQAIDQLHFESRGLAMESEMQFTADRCGLRMMEVPITVQYLDGSKRNPVVHGLEVLEAILGLVARRRPLAFLGFPGVVLVAVGVVVGLWVVSIVSHGHAIPLGTAILSSLLIITGFLLGMTGVILNSLEYFLTRISEEIHQTLAEQETSSNLGRRIGHPDHSSDISPTSAWDSSTGID